MPLCVSISLKDKLHLYFLPEVFFVVIYFPCLSRESDLFEMVA